MRTRHPPLCYASVRSSQRQEIRLGLLLVESANLAQVGWSCWLYLASFPTRFDTVFLLIGSQSIWWHCGEAVFRHTLDGWCMYVMMMMMMIPTELLQQRSRCNEYWWYVGIICWFIDHVYLGVPSLKYVLPGDFDDAFLQVEPILITPHSSAPLLNHFSDPVGEHLSFP